MIEEPAGHDPLSMRILQAVHDMQIGRAGRGVDADEIVERVTHGAIARRIAPNRSIVVSCMHQLVEMGYLRIDRWSRFRLTSSGWAGGLGLPRDTFPWGD
jgi:hypothetical protein